MPNYLVFRNGQKILILRDLGDKTIERMDRYVCIGKTIARSKKEAELQVEAKLKSKK